MVKFVFNNPNICHLAVPKEVSDVSLCRIKGQIGQVGCVWRLSRQGQLFAGWISVTAFYTQLDGLDFHHKF